MMAQKLKASGPVANPVGSTETKPKKKKADKVVEPARVYTADEKRETIERGRIQYDEILSLQGSMRNKSGQFSKTIADIAKMTGVSKAQVKWGFVAAKRDAAEIDAETKERNVIARLMGIKIGTQLGLFESEDGARSVGDQLERDAHAAKGGKGKAGTKASIDVAKFQGTKDGKDGTGYKNAYPEGSPEHLAYDGTYKDAQRKLAAGAEPASATAH